MLEKCWHGQIQAPPCPALPTVPYSTAATAGRDQLLVCVLYSFKATHELNVSQVEKNPTKNKLMLTSMKPCDCKKFSRQVCLNI